MSSNRPLLATRLKLDYFFDFFDLRGFNFNISANV
jgi:hypothetical protein